MGERRKEGGLTEKKRRAVELLFEFPEAEVAHKLRVSRQTLESWYQEMDFREGINVQMRGNRRATVRMLSKLYLDACIELSSVIHDKEDKGRHRVMVDVLKASGLLRESEPEEVDGVAMILARLGEEDEGVSSEE